MSFSPDEDNNSKGQKEGKNDKDPHPGRLCRLSVQSTGTCAVRFNEVRIIHFMGHLELTLVVVTHTERTSIVRSLNRFCIKSGEKLRQKTL